MANTYHQIYIHVIFAVKFRNAVIQKNWKKELYAVMGNIINEQGCKPTLINGMTDHVHCLFSMKPSVSISEIIKAVKARSSKWINENGKCNSRFEWQSGFACFSCSKSQVDTTYTYIQNQEKHHSSLSFRDEYLLLLQKHDIDFDEKYIFDGLR